MSALKPVQFTNVEGIGEVYELADFRDMALVGALSDDDGSAYWGKEQDGRTWASDVSFSLTTYAEPRPSWANRVIWYSK